MFGRKLLHILALAGAVLVVWSIAARPSGAHGPKTVYRVKPYDTLWTIARSHYGGDVRGARYGRSSTRTISPNAGQRLAARASAARARPVDGLGPSRPRRPGRWCRAGSARAYDRRWTSTSSSSAPPQAPRPPGAARARCSSAAAATGCCSTAARAPSASCCAPRSASSTSRTSSSPTSTPTTTSACPGMLKTFSLRDAGAARSRSTGRRASASCSSRSDAWSGSSTTTLELVELRAGDAVARDGYQVCAFPVTHGVPAVGYALVEEERPGRFDNDAADALGVPFGPERGALQRGEPVTLADGRVIRRRGARRAAQARAARSPTPATPRPPTPSRCSSPAPTS